MPILKTELRRDRVFSRNYYNPNTQYRPRELRWFDESPNVLLRVEGVNTSSIATSEIDQFRQGVELTQEKHNLGMFKVSAGTQGHMVDVNCFGITNMAIEPEGYFKSMERFTAVEFIQRKVLDDEEYVEQLIYPNFPVPTTDFDQSKVSTTNGVIEPLTIRAVALFRSMDFPYEYHDVHGSLMAGNSDARMLSSDRVLTVDYVPTRLVADKTVTSGSLSHTFKGRRAYINDDWYTDMFDYSIVQPDSQLQPTLTYSEGRHNMIDPFSDVRVYHKELGITVTKNGVDMVRPFLSRSADMTDNYVPPGKRSATSGMVYDYASQGTDSIAFGGMSY